MSSAFLDKMSVITPLMLMIELVAIVFMSKASHIMFGKAHGFVIAYIVTFVFLIIHSSYNLYNLCKLSSKQKNKQENHVLLKEKKALEELNSRINYIQIDEVVEQNLSNFKDHFFMLVEQHEEYFGDFDICDVILNKPEWGLEVYKNKNELIET